MTATINTFRAKWFVTRDDDGAVRLQIELGQDCAVLLTCSPEDGPRVSLWYASGSHDFEVHKTPESFGRWLDEVIMAQE